MTKKFYEEYYEMMNKFNFDLQNDIVIAFLVLPLILWNSMIEKALFRPCLKYKLKV